MACARALIRNIQESRSGQWWSVVPISRGGRGARRSVVGPAPLSIILADCRTADIWRRCSRQADLSLSCEPFPSFAALPPLLLLPSPIRLCNPLADLVFLRDVDVVQVNAIKQAFLHDLTHDLFLHLLRVEIAGAEQTPQARLMLYDSRGNSLPPGGRRTGVIAAARAIVCAPPRVGASLPPPFTPLPSPSFPRRLQVVHVGHGTRRVDAELPQAQLLHVFQQPALLVVVLSAPAPQLGHDDVPISELFPVRLLLILGLSPMRIRLDEHIQEGRHRGIGLRRPHGGAA